MVVRVEVCVTSVQEALSAASAGADSVELCTWLAAGGVTPSSGLAHTVHRQVPIAVRVLVRPSPGPFHYSLPELEALLHDTRIYSSDGMGVVTGALGPNGEWDDDTMRQIRTAAGSAELTFHRAIDHAMDPFLVAERCAATGMQRILTSGGASTALEGAASLRELIRCAPGVRIAAGGGIRPDNVVELVERSGVEEVHFSAQRWVSLPSGGPALGGDAALVNAAVEADLARIEGVLNALTKAGLR